MKYYYNKETGGFAITTNFVLQTIPQGYEEITEEEFNELINKEGEENDNQRN